MSRYALNNVGFTDELVQELNAEVSIFVLTDPDAHTVAFGFDHALGYFIQVIATEGVEYEDEDGERYTEMKEVIILDLDSMFTGLRGWELGYLIDKIYRTTKCGISMTTGELAVAVNRAYNDLPF